MLCQASARRLINQMSHAGTSTETPVPLMPASPGKLQNVPRPHVRSQTGPVLANTAHAPPATGLRLPEQRNVQGGLSPSPFPHDQSSAAADLPVSGRLPDVDARSGHALGQEPISRPATDLAPNPGVHLPGASGSGLQLGSVLMAAGDPIRPVMVASGGTSALGQVHQSAAAMTAIPSVSASGIQKGPLFGTMSAAIASSDPRNSAPMISANGADGMTSIPAGRSEGEPSATPFRSPFRYGGFLFGSSTPLTALPSSAPSTPMDGGTRTARAVNAPVPASACVPGPSRLSCDPMVPPAVEADAATASVSAVPAPSGNPMMSGTLAPSSAPASQLPRSMASAMGRIFPSFRSAAERALGSHNDAPVSDAFLGPQHAPSSLPTAGSAALLGLSEAPPTSFAGLSSQTSSVSAVPATRGVQSMPLFGASPGLAFSFGRLPTSTAGAHATAGPFSSQASSGLASRLATASAPDPAQHAPVLPSTPRLDGQASSVIPGLAISTHPLPASGSKVAASPSTRADQPPTTQTLQPHKAGVVASSMPAASEATAGSSQHPDGMAMVEPPSSGPLATPQINGQQSLAGKQP